MSAIDLPAFLRINSEERRAAWNQPVPPRVDAVTPPEGIPPSVEDQAMMSSARKSHRSKKAKRSADLPPIVARRSRAKPGKAATQAPGGKKPRSAARRSARAPKAVPGAHKIPRPGSKLEIVVRLLRRPEGCTAAEIMKMTQWPSVSVPQQAKAAGLTLRQVKDGKVTRYWAS